MPRLHGQDYGASSMRGKFNGLKSLIHEGEWFCILCCLLCSPTSTSIGKCREKSIEVALSFNTVSNVLNIVGVSCKCRDQLQDMHSSLVIEALQIVAYLHDRV